MGRQAYERRMRYSVTGVLTGLTLLALSVLVPIADRKGAEHNFMQRSNEFYRAVLSVAPNYVQRYGRIDFSNLSNLTENANKEIDISARNGEVGALKAIMEKADVSVACSMYKNALAEQEKASNRKINPLLGALGSSILAFSAAFGAALSVSRRRELSI